MLQMRDFPNTSQHFMCQSCFSVQISSGWQKRWELEADAFGVVSPLCASSEKGPWNELWKSAGTSSLCFWPHNSAVTIV